MSFFYQLNSRTLIISGKIITNIKLLIIGVNVSFNKISKIGLVEIMKLISLFKKHNLIIGEVLSGLNIIDLKMLNIWPKEDLELFMNYEAI
ncbi:hypothetical protein GLOIN_2v1549275 [Rhizophagus irregularis DAOM 181602=DAOM 197198]|nr:hypothetical protein GLOIN_2v1549275 [Rhizophagus irregularis DAOM 181602=DAOM 197198]